MFGTLVYTVSMVRMNYIAGGFLALWLCVD